MSLRVVSGPGAGQVFEVGEGVVIGRDEGLDLGGDPELSRRHARITRGPGGELLVEDLGSTNGTLVNGHRISAPTPVRSGDRIEAGGSVLEIAGEAAPAGAQATRAAPVPQAAQERPPRPGTAPAPAGAAPLPAGLGGGQHPAAKKSSKAPVAIAALVLGLIIGAAAAIVVSEDDEEAASGASSASFDGTLYTLSNGFAPKYKNSVLAYRTNDGSLQPTQLSEYPTGGTGAREANLALAIDGEQELNYDAERELLYAVNPGSDTIAVFRVESDRTLSEVEGSPFKSGGIAPISTGTAGDTLLVVNKGFDGVRQIPEPQQKPTLTQFEIGSDGQLSPLGRPISLPEGTNPTQVYVTRGGELAIVTLLRGNDYVTLTRQDDGTFKEGAKAPITDRMRAIGGPGGPPGGGGGPPPGAGGGGPPPGGGGGGPPPGAGGGGPPAGGGGAAPSGSVPEGALGMTEHPTEPVLYSELPNYSLLMVHEYDDSGALKFLRGVRIPQGFLACWAKVSADGRFLYVSNTGEHTIAVFDVSDPRNPKHLQTHPAPGPGSVASIQIDDEGGSLYAVDHFDPFSHQPGESNRLHAFKIGEDGRLSGGEERSLRLPVGADVSPIGAQWLASE